MTTPRTPLAPRSLGRRVQTAALALFIACAPAAAAAQSSADREPEPSAAACAPKPYRWQEDCSSLASVHREGLDRLRYLPLAEDGEAWLTLGGELRTRVETLDAVAFGIAGQPDFVEVSGRALLHGDLHTASGVRAFAQLGVVQQNGRRPEVRPQDDSPIDVTQAFVDLPAQLWTTSVRLRLGRSEVDLSRNRLVAARDGTTLRRAFQGAQLELATAEGFRATLLSVHPLELRDEAFADRAQTDERFNALSIDLPRSKSGSLNLFVLDRARPDRFNGFGRDRRYSVGTHYVGRRQGWQIDLQGQWQTGELGSRPVRAFGGGLQADRALGAWPGVTLNLNLGVASGDRASTRAVETFDPVYPNNFGLSDAPLIYQTNYLLAGGGLAFRQGPTVWAVGSSLLARESTSDAVYASGRPMPARFDDSRFTSLLSQVSLRQQLGPRVEFYGSLVWAKALPAISNAGGQDGLYSRVQLTARF